MDFDDFSEDNSQTEKILREREKIKDKLERKLRKFKFTDEELDEVFGIIDYAEAQIEKIKVSLNGTNINNPDPTPVMTIAFNNIEILQKQMAIDIRQKISDILEKKKKQMK